jgi:hypothetical protein
MTDEHNETIAFRVNTLEADVRELRAVNERIDNMEKDLEGINSSVSKITWTIMAFAFTMSSSAVALIVALVQN